MQLHYCPLPILLWAILPASPGKGAMSYLCSLCMCLHYFLHLNTMSLHFLTFRYLCYCSRSTSIETFPFFCFCCSFVSDLSNPFICDSCLSLCSHSILFAFLHASIANMIYFCVLHNWNFLEGTDNILFVLHFSSPMNIDFWIKLKWLILGIS